MLTEKWYACSAGEAHQLPTGTSMTPQHTCNENILCKAIMHHIDVTQEAMNSFSWTCMTCSQVNPGMDRTCMRAGCEDEGSRRNYVLENLLTRMEQEMILMPEAVGTTPELWSISMVMGVLLSPHNRANTGMLEGAFITPTTGDCACVAALGLNTDPAQLESSLSPAPGTPYTTPQSSSPALISPQANTDTAASSPSIPAPATNAEPLQAPMDTTVMDEEELQMSIDLSDDEIATITSPSNIIELERLVGDINLPSDQHTSPGTNGILTFPEEEMREWEKVAIVVPVPRVEEVEDEDEEEDWAEIMELYSTEEGDVVELYENPDIITLDPPPPPPTIDASTLSIRFQNTDIRFRPNRLPLLPTPPARPTLPQTTTPPTTRPRTQHNPSTSRPVHTPHTPRLPLRASHNPPTPMSTSTLRPMHTPPTPRHPLRLSHNPPRTMTTTRTNQQPSTSQNLRPMISPLTPRHASIPSSNTSTPNTLYSSHPSARPHSTTRRSLFPPPNDPQPTRPTTPVTTRAHSSTTTPRRALFDPPTLTSGTPVPPLTTNFVPAEVSPRLQPILSTYEVRESSTTRSVTSSNSRANNTSSSSSRPAPLTTQHQGLLSTPSGATMPAPQHQGTLSTASGATRPAPQQQPVPSAQFWWCWDGRCGRSNPANTHFCGFCGSPRKLQASNARKRYAGK